MDFVQTTKERIIILPDCCPNTKFLYYRQGALEMPLNCLTPCNNIVYTFKSLSHPDEFILHPMYGHPNLTFDNYIGPTKDTFFCYLQLLKDLKVVVEQNDRSDVLHFPHTFNKQRFLNKRYSKIDQFETSEIFNILVLHHEYYNLAKNLRMTLKGMGLNCFILYMTDVTLAKLGNLNGAYIIFGCFNKTLNLLYDEMSSFLTLYTAWDVIYYLNKESIDFCGPYYLNPLDIPKDYFDIKFEDNHTCNAIIHATSKYGTYSGLPVEDAPVVGILEGKRGIASEYHEI